MRSTGRRWARSLAVEEYIREHFDEALKKHYIQVFYQPVMRTMTGKLCGAEALARWESPEHGRLSPADFISVLENTRLIHRLDTYMIESVARRKRELLDAGKTTLPVSFNLSRLDFVLMDPFKVVEHIRKKYDLPYSALRVEVTEDALVEEESLVRDGIERFRAAGYEVWIDDFGSGYSSLNVLKDYAFDELKIDMAFLRPFNAASRKLLKGIISLAKKLGMHTLAEGVETQEQIDFLREIGCEKLQGYFYGMPMMYEDFCLHAEERAFAIEEPWEEQLLLPAGRVDVMNHEPLAFFYDDQKSLRMLYMNALYQSTLATAGTRDPERATRNLNSPVYPAFQRIRKLVQKAIRSRKWESATYVDNGQYMRVQLRTISAVQGRYIHLASLYNITLRQEEQEEPKRLDQLFRNVLQIYDGIYCLHPQQDTMEVLQPLFSEEREGEVRSSSLQLETFAASYLHPEDRARFRTFLDGMWQQCASADAPGHAGGAGRDLPPAQERRAVSLDDRSLRAALQERRKGPSALREP
jgi:EAL domain-containing protein (putative c-di-GMP-specific phosphodiesterase class I)